MAWTIGCLLMLAHLAAAFHFVHGWSHWHAYEDTARQTEELLGWPVGEGVYFNYVFVALWTLDTVAWWRRGAVSHLRGPRWWHWPVQAYLLFMVFNATVVFGHGWLRFVAAAAFAVIFFTALYENRFRPRQSRQG